MSGQGEPFQFAGSTLAAVGQFLYTDATSGGSGLSGFKIDPTTGSLSPVNTNSSTTGSWFVLTGNSHDNVLYASESFRLVAQESTQSSHTLSDLMAL